MFINLETILNVCWQISFKKVATNPRPYEPLVTLRTRVLPRYKLLQFLAYMYKQKLFSSISNINVNVGKNLD